jgi:hypothetical protein
VTPSRAYLDLIAERIAQALSPLVPPEYDVMASGGEVALVTRPNGPFLGYPFTDNVLDNIELNPGEPTGEVIASVTEHLLDSIQQDITMDLKMPWPPVVGKPLGHFAGEMAKVEGSTLHFWFEVDGHALLRAEVDLSGPK